MSQQRIHNVMYGKTERSSFSRIPDEKILPIPYLIELQRSSYAKFIDTGIADVLKEYSPIVDFSGRLKMEFLSHSLVGSPKYSVKECKDRDTTYAVPLRVKARLTNNETGEVVDQEVFMGDFPLMTEAGSFVINGAERVIVNQLVRSPGVYNENEPDKNGIPRYKTTVIPNRGPYIELEQDSNDISWVHVDRSRKITTTTLLRALGFGTDEELIELFGNDEMIVNTCNKDAAVSKSVDMGKQDLFKRMRPGEVPTIEGANILINNLFFDSKKYELLRVGRFKYNKKLALATRIAGNIAAEDVVNEDGEILAKRGEVISLEDANRIQNSGINVVNLIYKDADGIERTYKCIGNNTV
ncbi:MAG: DNA-directed RNA polymerase subunit beta, partial [Clostridia bacterium]|nr:DNA-directed RNA polymerase subunit beta [Clostridia bacterium]